ncbi:MAG: tRNA (adenosine(37)-N6)-threonylcarbamoyltransferase complex dimerization subunit type 1 TsaB [Erysipelothrix sp.]|nr:tRNA (adenosine(37)-N6)-threonylcarbamoyltransferase complex dimerization subunit type 1 TsaB [Erysipelothrix sp.]
MITLYLDTSLEYLHIGLKQDGLWIEKVSQKAFKKQSELTMPMIEELFKKHNIKPSQLQEIVLTSGPGSYTGVRIAMTIAKVLGAIAGVKVFTLNTLQAMAGLGNDTLAQMDARAKRSYVAIYDKGKEILAPTIMLNEEITHKNIVTQEDIDLLENMSLLKDYWQEVTNIHTLAPIYLKETTQYGTNN